MNLSFKKSIIPSFCFSAYLFASMTAQAEPCGLPYVDIWDSTDPDEFVRVATVKAIETAQTGQEHYDYYSASAHPQCVNPQPTAANTWMHQDTDTGDITFGFIFGKDGNAPENRAEINFRIVDSSTDPYVSQSDDPGEAVETPPDSDAFLGNYWYGANTDGVAVSGIGGEEWTVIVDSVDFGLVDAWFFSGGTCDTTDDFQLELGHEYRVTPACHDPSGKPVVVTDTDEDGVLDEDDECPETAPDAPVFENGCSVEQECPCEEAWKNHGAYVSCVAHASEELLELGVITEVEKDALCSAAGRSDCGAKKKK